jgi:hypothetical protein
VPDTDSAADTVAGMMPIPPMTLSVVIQMEPIWKQGEIGASAFGGDLQGFARSMNYYLVEQLQRFAGPRGADLFVTLSVRRGKEHAGHEFRNGHYVKGDATMPGELSGSKEHK